MSLVYGLPGFVAMAASFVMGPAASPGSPSAANPDFWAFLGLIGTLLLAIGLVYAFKFKGRNPAWTLFALFIPFGLIIVLALADLYRDRITELRCRLRDMGEAV